MREFKFPDSYFIQQADQWWTNDGQNYGNNNENNDVGKVPQEETGNEDDQNNEE